MSAVPDRPSREPRAAAEEERLRRFLQWREETGRTPRTWPTRQRIVYAGVALGLIGLASWGATSFARRSPAVAVGPRPPAVAEIPPEPKDTAVAPVPASPPTPKKSVATARAVDRPQPLAAPPLPPRPEPPRPAAARTSPSPVVVETPAAALALPDRPERGEEMPGASVELPPREPSPGALPDPLSPVPAPGGRGHAEEPSSSDIAL